MLHFKPLTFEDKNIFDYYFRQNRYEGSECTFTNLYMWRKTYPSQWAIIDNFLCLKVSLENMTYVLPPFGINSDIEKPIRKIITHFEEQNLPFIMRGISHKQKETFENILPNQVKFTEERDIFDYIYLVDDLIQLSGHYYRKRNHIKNFKKLYSDYKYHPLSEDLIDQCIISLKEWCEKKGCSDDKSLLCEMEAIIEALNKFGKLNYIGGVILIDNKVEAFTLGEELNDDTLVIHTEKANIDFKGIYQTINQEFLINQWQHMKYVNREEDMGIEGLRKAKLSYFPTHMVVKYKAELVNEV